MARLAMLIDLTRCIGCDACTVACKQDNGTPADVFFARVLNIEAGAYPDVKRVYVPVLCNHCENPACLKACPNKAIYRRQDGIVLIDQDRCRGTGACVSACPYGNIVLHADDRWYLPEDRAYERDHVRPRLKPNVARKCTFCAQRVDRGLDPACVVACPTTARIFGDTEDPGSRISTYVAEQAAETGRDPFKLLPEARTEPANLYLGTMAAQESATVEPGGATAHSQARPVGAVVATMLLALFFLLRLASGAGAQPVDGAEAWAASPCAGCHGPTAMGGLGPPLASTRLAEGQFDRVVRKGQGMMPAVAAGEATDAELAAIYRHVRATRLDPTQIPIAYKVGAMLTVPRVGFLFMVAGIAGLLLGLRVLAYWLDCAGLARLWGSIGKLGHGKAAGIVVRSLVVDGLFVSSLFRRDKARWLMHGLMLYGFIGLILTDVLLTIFDPLRSQLPLTHPLKVVANLSGLAILAGIGYVRYRYSRDEYIDNGITIGRDYLFLNLVAVTIGTGFLVEWLRYAGQGVWVQPVYVIHLTTVLTLIVTAPYTRFQHFFVAPALVAMTTLTNALVRAGVDLGFEREPSPGRHHKSQRIAAGVLGQVDPDHVDSFRLRYYP